MRGFVYCGLFFHGREQSCISYPSHRKSKSSLSRKNCFFFPFPQAKCVKPSNITGDSTENQNNLPLLQNPFSQKHTLKRHFRNLKRVTYASNIFNVPNQTKLVQSYPQLQQINIALLSKSNYELL